jgi:ribosomal protein S16
MRAKGNGVTRKRTSMNPSPRGSRAVAPLLGCLSLLLAARRDGCIIDRLGRYVPEQEQFALIVWHESHEHFYVSTRSVPSEQPILWVVPVGAQPDRVRAEPVKDRPRSSLTHFVEIAHDAASTGPAHPGPAGSSGAGTGR